MENTRERVTERDGDTRQPGAADRREDGAVRADEGGRDAAAGRGGSAGQSGSAGQDASAGQDGSGEALHRGRRETPQERADRNFAELLQELRVTQTGVQILFAFLLGLAFTARFSELDGFQRDTYIVTLLLAVVSAALFTAPAALHRMLFGQHAKSKVVHVSSAFASWGLGVLALALTGSVLLIVDFVLGRAEGVIAATGAGLLFAVLWAVIPWSLRRANERQDRVSRPE